MKTTHIKTLEASDERQYMLHENYEVYEKHGAPIGAGTMHYHNFYEIIYVLEGEYASLLGNQTYHMKAGDFSADRLQRYAQIPAHRKKT